MKKRIFGAILLVALALVSCAKDSNFLSWSDGSGSAFTVDGKAVMQSEVDYYFSGERNLDPDTPSRELFEKKVLPDILFARAAVLLAQESELTLSGDEQKGIDAAIEEMKNSTDKEITDKKSEKLYRHILEGTQLTTKLYEKYHDESSGVLDASDAKVSEATQSEDFVHFKSIVIINDPQDDKQENIALAERISSRLAAGEDFDELAKEFSEDPSYAEEGGDYHVFRYETIAEVEDAAFALKDGQVSDVIEVRDSYSGYSILMRLPVDEEWVNEHFETVRANYISYRFYSDVYARAATLKVEGTDNLYK